MSTIIEFLSWCQWSEHWWHAHFCYFPFILWTMLIWSLKISFQKIFFLYLHWLFYFCSHQFSSVTQLCPMLRPDGQKLARLPWPSPTPRACSNSWSRWCHPAISFSVIPSPPAPNPSQHQGLFQWVNSSHEVAKILEFQLQHQSFQWAPRTDLL